MFAALHVSNCQAAAECAALRPHHLTSTQQSDIYFIFTFSNAIGRCNYVQDCKKRAHAMQLNVHHACLCFRPRIATVKSSVQLPYAWENKDNCKANAANAMLVFSGAHRASKYPGCISKYCREASLKPPSACPGLDKLPAAQQASYS